MTTAQDQQSRAEFEAKFGPMPSGCTWTGRGYCPTEFNAWKAQEYANKFEGWQAARALPAGVEPVGYLIDWPDEPELGHYFSEEANDSARSQALHTAAQVQAMGRVPPEMPAPDFYLDGGSTPCFYAPTVQASLSEATRPPAAQERQPLKASQILSMDIRGTRDEALRFARAIEAAHGITHPTGD